LRVRAISEAPLVTMSSRGGARAQLSGTGSNICDRFSVRRGCPYANAPVEPVKLSSDSGNGKPKARSSCAERGVPSVRIRYRLIEPRGIPKLKMHCGALGNLG